MINKIFNDLKKLNAKDQKITIVTLKFSIEKFERIRKSHTLSNIAIDVIYLINSFGKKHHVKKEVKVYMVDDSLQMINKDTC